MKPILCHFVIMTRRSLTSEHNDRPGYVADTISKNEIFAIGTKVEERQQPDCDTACCGGVMPGRWTRPDPAGDPGRRDYVPDAAQGCSYFPYRRAELLDKLLGEVGLCGMQSRVCKPCI